LFVLLYEAAVLAVSEAPKLAGSIPARRAGDDETVAVVQTILDRSATPAATLKAAFPEAAQTTYRNLGADITPTGGADARHLAASPELDLGQDDQVLLPGRPDQHFHRKGLADACVLLAQRRRDRALGALFVAHCHVNGRPCCLSGEVDGDGPRDDDLLPLPVERISGRDRHLSSSLRALMHLEAVDDSPTMEKPVVATRLLTVIELLLLELVDANDLADEVARTLGHDPDGRRGSGPTAPVGVLGF
jgi:hypothetical protein